MEKFLFILIFIYLINPIFPTTHFEKPERYLHVYEDQNESNKPLVIENTDLDLAEAINQRYKRDLSSSDRNENQKNITTKVNTQRAPLITFDTRVRGEELCVVTINCSPCGAIKSSALI